MPAAREWNLQMHFWQTLAPASSGHPPASAFLAGKKKAIPCLVSLQDMQMLQHAEGSSMLYGNLKSQMPLSYTLYQPRYPSRNSDQSSHGQHREVNNDQALGTIQGSCQAHHQLSKSILGFTQHPHCTLLAFLKSRAFEKQANHRVQKQVRWPLLG